MAAAKAAEKLNAERELKQLHSIRMAIASVVSSEGHRAFSDYEQRLRDQLNGQ